MKEGSSDRYFQDAEGEGAAERLVPQGSKARPVQRRALRGDPPADGRPARGHGLLRLRDDRGVARAAEFVEITSAGIRESHVHDVQIVKEAPNYRVE